MTTVAALQQPPGPSVNANRDEDGAKSPRTPSTSPGGTPLSTPPARNKLAPPTPSKSIPDSLSASQQSFQILPVTPPPTPLAARKKEAFPQKALTEKTVNFRKPILDNSVTPSLVNPTAKNRCSTTSIDTNDGLSAELCETHDPTFLLRLPKGYTPGVPLV